MWQPSEDLQGILEYLEANGLSREVIKARIFEIFMNNTSLSISLKAGELLDNFSEDDDYSGELPYSQLLIVQNLTKKILGAKDDNLAAVIADVSQQSDPTSDIQSIPPFLSRISSDNVPTIPASPTQSGHHASPDTGETGKNQKISDRDATQTRQDGDN